MNEDKPPLVIDLVQDYVCPWCYIGFRGLDWASMALSFSYAVVRRYRPFRLYPEVPVGTPRQAYLERRYGDLTATRDALREAMRDVGLDFDPALPTIIPDTTDAHRLVRWAQEEGAGQAAAGHVYEAYWRHGEDISQREVLKQIAARAGLDADAIADRLAGTEDRETVRQEAEEIRGGGVANVPTFIVGEEIGFHGALPKADLLAELQALAAETAGDPDGS